MPQKKATKRATKKRKGSTSAAGEYVREEMHDLKKGRFKSRKQAIAVGLSRARRAGKDVAAPKKGKTSAATRKKAKSDSKAAHKRTAKRSTSSARKASGQKTTAAKHRTTTKRARKTTARRAR